MIVSFIILMLGLVTWKIFFDKILMPEETVFSYVTVGILIVSILIKNMAMFPFYRRIAKTIASSTLKATSADSFNDVIATTVVLIGAIISSVCWIQFRWLYGYGCCVVYYYFRHTIGNRNSQSAIRTSTHKKLVKELEERITSREDILGIHDLKVHNYGASSCFATVHCGSSV